MNDQQYHYPQQHQLTPYGGASVPISQALVAGQNAHYAPAPRARHASASHITENHSNTTSPANRPQQIMQPERSIAASPAAQVTTVPSRRSSGSGNAYPPQGAPQRAGSNPGPSQPPQPNTHHVIAQKRAIEILGPLRIQLEASWNVTVESIVTELAGISAQVHQSEQSRQAINHTNSQLRRELEDARKSTETLTAELVDTRAKLSASDSHRGELIAALQLANVKLANIGKLHEATKIELDRMIQADRDRINTNGADGILYEAVKAALNAEFAEKAREVEDRVVQAEQARQAAEERARELEEHNKALEQRMASITSILQKVAQKKATADARSAATTPKTPEVGETTPVALTVSELPSQSLATIPLPNIQTSVVPLTPPPSASLDQPAAASEAVAPVRIASAPPTESSSAQIGELVSQAAPAPESVTVEVPPKPTVSQATMESGPAQPSISSAAPGEQVLDSSEASAAPAEQTVEPLNPASGTNETSRDPPVTSVEAVIDVDEGPDTFTSTQGPSPAIDRDPEDINPRPSKRRRASSPTPVPPVKQEEPPEPQFHPRTVINEENQAHIQGLLAELFIQPEGEEHVVCRLCEARKQVLPDLPPSKQFAADVSAEELLVHMEETHADAWSDFLAMATAPEDSVADTSGNGDQVTS